MRLLRRARGFTLIELLVAITVIAIASATVVVAMRNRGSADLEREALHLAAALESARAEARAAGLDVRWVPGNDGRYRFTGLPSVMVDHLGLERPWLSEAPMVDIYGPVSNGRTLRLGPEPLIGAQRVVLTRGEDRIALVTDGLSPFTLQRNPPP